MELTKENEFFWRTLETNLMVEIPKHIKNAFSLYGFANAFIFKDLTENDIHDVELFVREELLEILQKQFDVFHEHLTEDNMVSYFGCHSSNTETFVFSAEDKNIICKCIKNVNYVVDLDGINMDLARFALEENVESAKVEANTESKNATSKIIPETMTHIFLKKLLHMADQNVSRRKEGYRFSNDIKNFATYMRMVAGPLAYEFLQKNLELSLPSLSSTNKYIRKNSNNIVEGVLRSQELSKYLKERNVDPYVVLGEDATRITDTIQYDRRTNQLVGFVLPTNERTGMPIPFTYKARSAEEMLKHFLNKKPIGHFVNVIMAQPVDRSPPFCLLIFCSDSKYTAETVGDRWDFIVAELKTVGVTILGISSDSDPKYNSAMKRNSALGKPSNLFFDTDWFSCGDNLYPPFYFQDTFHIATKMRNLMLTTMENRQKLPFGTKYFIQIKHLQYLIDNFSKDEHLLTQSTLNAEDRQNFPSVLRMCSKNVINLLENKVVRSKGTSTFLKILRDIIDSFLDKNLTPLQRIRKIWFALFVIRLWREYVVNSSRLKVTENFMSSNCYTCIELNAHSLILLLLYLKDQNIPEKFLLQLYTSQVCEEFFRKIRSFTTVYSTIVNCSVKEIIARIDKIQLQNDIAFKSNFIFPRLKSGPIPKDSVPILPSKEEICREIEYCKSHAIEFATKIGLITKETRNQMICGVVMHRHSDWYYLPDEEIDSIKLPSFGHVELKDYSKKIDCNSISGTSPYVKIHLLKKVIIVKKTSLCWLLRTDAKKLSSDRLHRVKSKLATKVKAIRIPSKILTRGMKSKMRSDRKIKLLMC